MKMYIVLSVSLMAAADALLGPLCLPPRAAIASPRRRLRQARGRAGDVVRANSSERDAVRVGDLTPRTKIRKKTKQGDVRQPTRV